MHRTQAGRLHLVDHFGKVPLTDITLVEDPSEDDKMNMEGCSSPTGGGGFSSDEGAAAAKANAENAKGSNDFKLIVEDIKSGEQVRARMN